MGKGKIILLYSSHETISDVRKKKRRETELQWVEMCKYTINFSVG